MEQYLFRIWCNTESAYVESDWATDAPTECPNDAGHSIDTNSIAIISTQDVYPHTYISMSFNNKTIPYIEVDSDSWTTIAAFEYCGCDAVVPDVMTAVVSRAGTTGTSKIRLRDITNNNTIENKTWTGEEQQIIMANTFSDLPTDAAIFEIQVKQLAVGDSAGRVWDFHLRRTAE